MTTVSRKEYEYHNADADHTQHYLWKPVFQALENCVVSGPPNTRVLDVGCGNGAFAGEMHRVGYCVTGLDSSVSGIEVASRSWPKVSFQVASAYDDLHAKFGLFDVVTSLEVIEHLYSPREFAKQVFRVLRPGGFAVISTPFHGYWKNLILALAGKLDSHFSPLWDHGHIKFWSVKSLESLFLESGFRVVEFKFAGRFYPFSMSMIVILQKPLDP